jgi:hypothetical protein
LDGENVGVDGEARGETSGGVGFIVNPDLELVLD